MCYVRTFIGIYSVKKGIMVDPLKVEAIVQLAPQGTFLHLKSLQGKDNVSQRFINNCDEITKGFIHLLKKGVPFFLNEVAQHSFEALKIYMMSTPLLIPPDYGKDFLLYLVAAESTINMVLFQEDDTL
jgi:hypothetical protein